MAFLFLMAQCDIYSNKNLCSDYNQKNGHKSKKWKLKAHKYMKSNYKWYSNFMLIPIIHQMKFLFNSVDKIFDAGDDDGPLPRKKYGNKQLLKLKSDSKWEMIIFWPNVANFVLLCDYFEKKIDLKLIFLIWVYWIKCNNIEVSVKSPLK